MMIKGYKYKTWAGFDVPMIPVAFSRWPDRGFINSMCLVDSGAFMTTLSYAVADVLGIDVGKGIPITVNGVGGTGLAYEHQVYFKIKNRPAKIKVLFYQGLDINIIGRLPIFDQFLIIFNNSKGRLWLIG